MSDVESGNESITYDSITSETPSEPFSGGQIPVNELLLNQMLSLVNIDELARYLIVSESFVFTSIVGSAVGDSSLLSTIYKSLS